MGIGGRSEQLDFGAAMMNQLAIVKSARKLAAEQDDARLDSLALMTNDLIASVLRLSGSQEGDQGKTPQLLAIDTLHARVSEELFSQANGALPAKREILQRLSDGYGAVLAGLTMRDPFFRQVVDNSPHLASLDPGVATSPATPTSPVPTARRTPQRTGARQQLLPAASFRFWVATLFLIGIFGGTIWLFATGNNCTDGPVDPSGHYLRTCSGPDFGNDPNQRP